MSRSSRQIDLSPSKLRELADEDLMELVCNNEAAAFEVVMERHVNAAFSLAYRMIGRRALAEDVVQEALLSLWRGGARYDRSRGSVRNWILGITHHRAVDSLRRDALRTARNVSDDDLHERLEAPEQTEVEVVRRDEAKEVRTALDALPAEQVRVIELAYFGGFTHTEIAAMLGLPVGTVKGRMRLGLEKMRSRLSTSEAVT
ncbi:MAG TPA: sigma-70 family RNA polymerase sigma factor [Solirubrobacteraceae bacterium]|jgi:RNA polymerase sigma-70 factor (ECF subfamily)|nr:sigma-70 family RNA polymerase sigma factor [Solirubrobacteraceae bacterium]